MNRHYYITTTLPYVNADPHIGFALEIIQADVLARYHRFLGEEVVFNTGTDEHGIKIYRKAREAEKDAQIYVDEYAARFHALKDALDLSYTNFIRTTDNDHKKAAQKFWSMCLKNGDIYKKNYKVKYCIGCELEKTDSELENGKCTIHPSYEIELIEEENYFFRFSKYQKALLDLYEKDQNFVVPRNRLKEVKNFVQSGLQDFSISRLKEKMPWGVPVPGDDQHVMYVWFDALINYISTLGWPTNKKNFASYWPGVQVAGKDNLRQQSAMWQAMLLSAGIETSRQIFIHGFITVDGQKMSKSTGNVINPFDLVKQYGTDPSRLFLLGSMNSYQDGDFSHKEMIRFYETHLQKGIGNLTSRIVTMIEKYVGGKIPASAPEPEHINTSNFWKEYEHAIQVYRFDQALEALFGLVSQLDQYISTQEPWKLEKEGKDISGLLYQCAELLRHIAVGLLPFAPKTAQGIASQLGMNVKLDQKDTTTSSGEWKPVWGGLEPGTQIGEKKALFPPLAE